MLVVRPALSVFSAVYRFIECSGRVPFHVWPSVRHELRMAMCIAPLLHVSVAAQWFPQVVACDASLDGQGVCAARLPEAVISAAAAHSGVIVPQHRDAAVEEALDAPLAF